MPSTLDTCENALGATNNAATPQAEVMTKAKAGITVLKNELPFYRLIYII
jgi:hypothetical protein